MFEAILQFTLSAAAIILAGAYLTRCADSIAENTGLGKALVGGIFLAGATSLPELLVDLSAIRKGMPNLAVGDLLGSSLFNLLILAIADLLHKNTGRIFSHASAAHALAASISIALTAIVAAAILLAPHTSGFGIQDIGVGPIAVVLAYVLGIRLIYIEQKLPSRKNGANAEKSDARPNAMRKAIAGYLFCALIILVAAPYLADAAGTIADLTGLGKTFVGTTLVALCTSLPELVSTITAVRMGSFDLALGNIFGSNSFNMMMFVPLDFAFPGSLFAAVSQIHVLTALAVIIVTSVAIVGQLYQVEKRKKFIEPDAFTVIGVTLGFLTLLYFFRAEQTI